MSDTNYAYYFLFLKQYYRIPPSKYYVREEDPRFGWFPISDLAYGGNIPYPEETIIAIFKYLYEP